MIAELTNITKAYRAAPDSPEQRVLSGLNLTIAAGETLSISGPSGCGKSTVLNLLGTLDEPDRGSVRLFGSDVPYGDEKALSALRSEKLGFIFQMHHLLPQCTALENVLIPTLGGATRPDAEESLERARRLLNRVGLGAHTDKKPAQLSGGERQRVAVVRALIRNPGLLLADEPTGALDAAGAGRLMELLLDLNSEEGTALVLVTHDAALAARMSRKYRLNEGILTESA
ncbi:MAG: lolD 1 [Verrucomicrobiales bacterium]|nr:lolD 1 [Verrucomicrobiales bacterium]